MSTFLIHQEHEFAVLLSDSLGTKSLHPVPPGPGSSGSGRVQIPVTAPKMVHVCPGAYAVHAGTWQPALEMLNAARSQLIAPGWCSNWEGAVATMQSLGSQIYERYKEIFSLPEFDVRVALVLTGELRHPEDIAANRSTTLILWEAARAFEPILARGYLHFAGTRELSNLATTILSQEVMLHLLRQSPLSSAQALVATHALLSRVSTQIGADVNVLVVGKDTQHTVLHGALVDLAQAAILKG